MFTNIYLLFQCRLIVAQMSNTRCDGWNSQLTMLLVATVVCVLPYQLIGLPAVPFIVEKWIIYCLALLVSVLHFHYGRGVVRRNIFKALETLPIDNMIYFFLLLF